MYKITVTTGDVKSTIINAEGVSQLFFLTGSNAVMELEAGSVDAVAMDIGVANEKLKSGNFRILDEIVITEQYGVGFKKGNTALRDTVQKTLLDMVADGSAAKISAKYFKGKDVLIIGK